MNYKTKRNRLIKLENIFNVKIYESDHQIVYRGINHDLIKDHINSKVEKILCIYDTKENFLKAKLNYNSDRLVLYEIYNEVDNL